MGPVAQLLVVVAGLLIIGAVGEFIFSRTGIPNVVWLALAGIFARPILVVVPLEFSTPRSSSSGYCLDDYSVRRRLPVRTLSMQQASILTNSKSKL